MGFRAALIRAATLSDLPQIVAVHNAAFHGFFLTMLGGPFLYELYRGFLLDPSSICLAAEDQAANRLLGFVVGTMEPRGFFKRLLIRRGHGFVFAGLAALLQHPLKVARRFLDALVYRGEAPEGLERATLLSSVAVSPADEGQGVGRMLVERFCQQATSRGARSVYLLTDSDGNETVNQFYLRCGFVLEASVLRRDGRHMNRHVRPLTTALAVSATASGTQ
jgi:ribosomal protein S18 acetylase RimI-like enzyme